MLHCISSSSIVLAKRRSVYFIEVTRTPAFRLVRPLIAAVSPFLRVAFLPFVLSHVLGVVYFPLVGREFWEFACKYMMNS